VSSASASISVLEHDELLIGASATASSLTFAEVDQLSRIAEMRPGFCSRGVQRVRFAQYAGLVGLGGRVLEILPKVDSLTLPPERCRKILLRLLGLAEGLRLIDTGDSEQGTCRMPLLDVFIASFFEEVANLIRGGLLHRYRAQEDDLQVVRGKILIQRQIGANALRMDRIACRYDELTADNNWNRVLKAALRLVGRRITSVTLRRRWGEIWPAFDEVSELEGPVEFLKGLTPDRQAARYNVAVRWANWILSTLSPSLRSGTAEAPGFLVDTNQLFERAVARHLRRQLANIDTRYLLECQPTGTFLAQVSKASGERMIGLRPDLQICMGSVNVLVADTKWKRIDMSPSGYLTPISGDVQQMLAYAAAFDCEELALIYPWHDGLTNARETVLHLPPAGRVIPRLHIVILDVGCDGLPLRRGEQIAHLFNAAAPEGHTETFRSCEF